MILKSNNKVPFLCFESLSEIPLISHGFSTRLGGVSKEHLSSMNLGFEKGDKAENVIENYNRIGKALGIKPEAMVMAKLVHETTVKRVYKTDSGKGVTCSTDFEGCDGLITNVPGVCLVSRYADCVPLFFVDPVNKAIGLAHSGWRGPSKKMGQKMVEAMTREFNTDPKDLITAIGPSICAGCFEVGEEVARIFRDEFPEICDKAIKSGEGGKFYIDLWECNKFAIKSAGVLTKNIELSNLCTCCNKELLFSHRATNGRRGDMAGFLMLKE